MTRQDKEKGSQINNRKQKEYLKMSDLEAVIYLFRLIQGALTKITAEDKPAKLTWDELYQLSVDGAVAGICYYGIENLKTKPSKEIEEKWRRERDRIIFKQICFDVEREEILGELAEKGVSCLPFKGVHLLSYYPEAGMRDMIDNDILYGIVERGKEGKFHIRGATREVQADTFSKAREIVNHVMRRRGYTKEELGLDFHEEFLRKPIFNFEMHQRFAGQGIAYNYYEDSWKLAIQDPENPYLFFMRGEDEYIQLFAHEYGHFMRGDSKLRFLVDLYVFLNDKAERLDWNYIHGELKTLGLSEFEYKLRTLSETLFLKKSLSSSQRELLGFLIEKTDVENFEISKVKGKLLLQESDNVRKNKLRYIWNRICIPEAECRAYYPFVYRHRWTMPFLILYRLAKGLILERQKFVMEFRSLWKI